MGNSKEVLVPFRNNERLVLLGAQISVSLLQYQFASESHPGLYISAAGFAFGSVMTAASWVVANKELLRKPLVSLESFTKPRILSRSRPSEQLPILPPGNPGQGMVRGGSVPPEIGDGPSRS